MLNEAEKSFCVTYFFTEFIHAFCQKHLHSPCLWVCWSDPSLWPVCPCLWRTGLSGPAPEWQRCVPVTVWQHRCGGSGFPPGSRALQTEAGRRPEASGAPGCIGPCRKDQPAPLVLHLRGNAETENETGQSSHLQFLIWPLETILLLQQK